MKNEDIFDLGYLLNIFKKHWIFIIVSGLIAAAASFCVSEFVIEKKYQSKALLYIENNSKISDSVNLNDINASQQLVYACQIIFKSDTVIEMLIGSLDLPYTKKELDKIITIQVVNNTQLIRLIAETQDPAESEMIVNELVRLSKNEFYQVIKSGSLEVIDYGKISTAPSSPNIKLITAAGLLLGLAAAYVFSFIESLIDTAVKRDDNLSKIYGVPVFANIYDFMSIPSSGYGSHSAGGKENGEQDQQDPQEPSSPGGFLISPKTPFAIAESYNTARTNIMFAASTSTNKIIAVTSSKSSEGKSTTCANIAVSFANAGQKVLLMECDMRKPTISGIFGIKAEKGLSSLIGGFCEPEEAICNDVIKNLDIIPAGDIPPNPSELLASELMKKILLASARCYDYVFLDTPPVNVVTDSQLFNDEISGLIFVVKEGKTTHPEIQSALEKIRLANGKTMGIIKTFCRAEKTSRYGKNDSYYQYDYKYSRKNQQDQEKSSAEQDGGKKEKKSGKPAGIILRIILVLCIIACFLFIWIHSLMPKSISGEESSFVNDIINRFMGKNVFVDDLVLRKVAHFIEFMILGIFLSLISYKNLIKRLPAALLIGLAAALGDETIQLFSDGRYSRVVDVWIDFGGVTAGIAVILLIKGIASAVRAIKNRSSA